MRAYIGIVPCDSDPAGNMAINLRRPASFAVFHIQGVEQVFVDAETINPVVDDDCGVHLTDVSEGCQFVSTISIYRVAVAPFSSDVDHVVDDIRATEERSLQRHMPVMLTG